MNPISLFFCCFRSRSMWFLSVTLCFSFVCETLFCIIWSNSPVQMVVGRTCRCKSRWHRHSLPATAWLGQEPSAGLFPLQILLLFQRGGTSFPKSSSTDWLGWKLPLPLSGCADGALVLVRTGQIALGFFFCVASLTCCWTFLGVCIDVRGGGGGGGVGLRFSLFVFSGVHSCVGLGTTAGPPSP